MKKRMSSVTLLFMIGLIVDVNAIEVQQFLGVKYMTGGIGVEEVAELEEKSAKFPLKILVAKGDRFLSDVDISISDHEDKLILQVTTDGPFLYVNLKPGKYRIQAFGYGESFDRKITISGDKQARIVFRWPVND